MSSAAALVRRAAGQLDLRVGRIVAARAHPDADSLLIEEIEVGDEAPRQIVSALVGHVETEELAGRTVAVLCNLKSSKMRGVLSEGMLLCAQNEKGNVALIEPPAAAQVGERIGLSGDDAEPHRPHKRVAKLFSEAAAAMRTDKDGLALCGSEPFATSAGPCTATVREGIIR